jgi:RNA polymerase sigma factor (TIGR02999 family)
VDVETAQHWDSRGHFFAAAAEAMRRILVDRARQKSAAKFGAGRGRISLDDNLAEEVDADGLLELNEALAALETHDAGAAKLVKLRYFAGLTHKQAAEVMGISRRAADRLWKLAKTWLYRQISDG